ncbi:MAG: cell division protein ZapA [Succinivibrionaceae bacterium]|nr:cell division protein ZapA [Succinivibrionaceae bacterium]
MAGDSEAVTFTLLGENFSLRCDPAERARLEAAVEQVRTMVARSLREHPGLSPQQTAILTAIECASRLQGFLGGSTAFIDAGNRIAQEMERSLAALVRKEG